MLLSEFTNTLSLDHTSLLVKEAGAWERAMHSCGLALLSLSSCVCEMRLFPMCRWEGTAACFPFPSFAFSCHFPCPSRIL